MNLTYQGESFERNERCWRIKKIYQGSRDELESYLQTVEIGSGGSSGEIYAASGVLSQKDGPVWQLEITYIDPDGGDGSFNRKPDTSYGKRSAKLECSCITTTIETLESYKKNWDHYLLTGDYASEDGTALRENLVPPFWETADASFVMPREYLRDYRWVKDPAECPSYVGNDRRKWRILCNPTKPGVTYVDKAVYKITESVRCRTSAQAGTFAADVINKITVPSERFGIKNSRNCWKCDSASIHWDGKDWIATIIYTMSPDPAGWDQDLYGTSSK